MARRLLLTYLALTALTLAVVVVPLGRLFATREHDRLTVDIERDAQAVASLVEDALEAGSAPSIARTLDSYADSGGRIVVVDEAGVAVADSDDPGAARRDFSTRPEIARALQGQRTEGTRHSATLRTDLLYVALPVTSGGAVHGAVRITYPTSTVDARVRSMWVRLGVLSAVVLAIVALVGLAFANGVTRPVRRLQRAAASLAAGDLTVRVDTDDGPPELRSLAETFNTTAHQLAQLLDSQHRFVADASHQLRTPLTALRLRLETLQPFVAPAAQPKLDAALAETNRLGRLVHSLLVLARTDAARSQPEPVAISTVVADRLDAWSPVASDQGVRLESTCPPDRWARAVPGAVEQMLDNLIANALDVAPAGTAVTISMTSPAGLVELHVSDRGPGMSDEARERAFERFWRSPAAATDGPGDAGFGLGLAIVARLAENSGGTARLEAGEGGVGLEAVISLPAAGAPTPQPGGGGQPP